MFGLNNRSEEITERKENIFMKKNYYKETVR